MHLLFKSTMLILLSYICLDSLSDQCLTLKTVSFVFLKQQRQQQQKNTLIYLTLDLESKTSTAYSESKEGLWNSVQTEAKNCVFKYLHLNQTHIFSDIYKKIKYSLISILLGEQFKNLYNKNQLSTQLLFLIQCS